MLSRKAFFSFVELTDPSRHAQYNAYHQLDHRPANLALRSVVWGDRWVRSPECAELSGTAAAPLDRVHYMAMYWFADPVDESVKEWRELGERAFQWGRKPDTDWSKRELGYFVPLKGYVNSRVRVSADVLPFRPVRGVHAIVTVMKEPHSSATEEMYRWYDEVHLPDLLSCDGVAGAWTFYSDWTTLLAPEDRRVPGGARVVLLYLDGDPLQFVQQRDELKHQWEAAGRLPNLDKLQTVLLDSPFLDIRPWEWSWFDKSPVDD